MKKIRLVELLLLVADKKLKDGQMVLIDNACYKFDKNEEKFYLPKDHSSYRAIRTYDMNLNCYLLENYVEEGE
ncbi:MAG: hypothetical protein PUF66_00900 [Clostridium sp.]|nr:hypothetical protein [Clostridium sp.]